MKTLITNSEISNFFQKTGTNIGITFPIVKDFHNLFLSCTLLSFDSISKSPPKIGSPESLKYEYLISHSTFKKIVSFTDIQESSSVLKFLHFKTEKRILAFLRYAKNKIKNGKLMSAWKNYVKSHLNKKVKSMNLENTLWFIIESKKRSVKKESSVKIVSMSGGAKQKLNNLKNLDLDLDNFNKVLCEIGIIGSLNDETASTDPEQNLGHDKQNTIEKISNEHENFIKWAANQIKLRT